MRFKTKILSAAMLSAFGMVGSAQAVHLSEDGRGQVLLYPYYSSLGGNDTIVSLVNTTTSAKAVKIRFIEAKNSHEVLDFNLNMSPGDAWAGVVTLDAASGNTVLKTGDTSCTVPAIPAQASPSVTTRSWPMMTAAVPVLPACKKVMSKSSKWVT